MIIIIIILSTIIVCGILLLIKSNTNMNQISDLELKSIFFENNGKIPSKYTCDGENINPLLEINKIPNNTKSLALIVDDPDAPSGDWVHWLMWNIPPQTTIIESNFVPPGSIQGINDSKENKYDGPCPPSGTHRYFFKLYALDIILDLNKDNKKQNLEKSMIGHILGQTELIGLYSRQ